MFKKSFLKKIAKKEKVSCQLIEKGLNEGTIVIPLNNKKEIGKPVAIGENLKIKINTNLGISTDKANLEEELEKLHTAIKYGTDAIMDLSVGKEITKVRKEIISHSSVPVGTVPIYEAAIEVERKKGSFEKMKISDFLDTLDKQAKEGVDFFTIHAGVRKEALEILEADGRRGGIVSRGGAIISRWMYVNKKENFLYTHFEKILKILKKYNITLSLGDGLRPGALDDSTDRLQLHELFTLGELVKKARAYGVQVMVEGPGHVKINEVAYNMALEKKICHKAPFYVLGPLTTDIAMGYDHISAAIGGAIAALNGANFLCVVTPAEHLRQPSVNDIKEGVIASRIAAHSVDLLNFADEAERDSSLSRFRARRDWKNIFKYSLDLEKSKKYHNSTKNVSSVDVCTMCGKYCSLKLLEKCELLK